MQFDQSTTTVALGKITMAKAAGEPIPEGWAVDSKGNPTTDPAAALTGSLVSMGGYKGWGFGLMAEILAAAMTGGTLSKDVKPLKTPDGPPHDLGQYYMIIDPSNAPSFAEQVKALATAATADTDTRMPGQFSKEKDVIDVPDALWDQITGLANRRC